MNDHDLMRSILDDAISGLDHDRFPLLVPPRRGLRKTIPLHNFHEYPELFFQIHGTNRFSMPFENIDLSAGSMMIVPPELPHHEEAFPDENGFLHLVLTPGNSKFMVHLARAHRMQSGRGMAPVMGHYEQSTHLYSIEIRKFISSLVPEYPLQDSYSPGIARGLLQVIFRLARRSLEESSVKRSRHPHIDEIERIILSHYHQPWLKVGAIARQLNRSADYLSWLFHRETGTNLNSYIRDIRLSRAVEMLRETDYQISEIAWNCGFSSPAYFSRVFTASFGNPPQAHRKLIQRS